MAKKKILDKIILIRVCEVNFSLKLGFNRFFKLNTHRTNLKIHTKSVTLENGQKLILKREKNT